MRRLAPLVLAACANSSAPPGGAVDDAGAAETDAGPPFADVSAEMGLDFEREIHDAWLSLPDTMGGGACLFDLEGDGDLDLLFTDRTRARLYRMEGGRLQDATAELPVPLTESMGCATGDYDADGDLDLYVTSVLSDVLLRNDDGRLLDVTADVGIDAPGYGTCAAWGDVDGDRDLDLFVGQFVGWGSVDHPEECTPLPCDLSLFASDPLPNLLWLNDGGTFREAAADRGMTEAEPTLACAMWDFEEDGDLDVFVANDIGARYPDRLYRNDGTGRFADVAPFFRMDEDDSGHGGDGMGVAVGDPDADGRWEVAVTNFQYFRVTYFDCDAVDCRDRGFEAGLDVTRELLSWGIGFEDFDLDGRQDLFISNGHVHTEEMQRVLGRTGEMEMRPQLLWNTGERYSQQDFPAGGALEAARHGRGVAFGDLDADGDVDVVQAVASGRPWILRNDAASGGFVRVRPVSPGTDAVGAVVRVRTAAGEQMRAKVGGGSYLAASEDVLTFGIADATEADVEVSFAGGETVTLQGVPAGTTLVVEEP